MKPTTTILLALLIGAGAISQQSQAYNVTAPPEIVEAEKLWNEYAGHVIRFGTHCLNMTLSGFPDAESCDKFRQAAAKMGEHAQVYLEWVNAQIDAGATTAVNIPENNNSKEALEIIGKVIRARSYQ